MAEMFGPGYGKSIYIRSKDLPENETTLFISRPVVQLIFDGIPFKLFDNPLVQVFSKSNKFAVMEQVR